MPLNVAKEYRSNFERAYAQVAEVERIPLVPSILEGVAADQNLNLEDQLHPNAEGQRRVAANVFEVLYLLIENLK